MPSSQRPSSKDGRPPVRVRIAPSPTGWFHLGTARTALFNYLFAKTQGGKFLLRIEDTDPERSKEEYIADIIDQLKWLSLSIDEPPIYQSQRMAVYERYILSLTKSGLLEKRDGALVFLARRLAGNQSAITFDDRIRGQITIPTSQIDDFVIVRNDGQPLFLFASLVDDFETGISHVIRGEDHISNTPRQILLSRALSIPSPEYGHLPIILTEGRAKLSKRHGAKPIKDLRVQGITPEAVINLMALLGWHPSGDREIFTLKELEKEFSLLRVRPSSAIFNEERLVFFNRAHLRMIDQEDYLARLRATSIFRDREREKFRRVALLFRERIGRLTEFDALANHFFDRPSFESNRDIIFKKSDRSSTRLGLTAALKAISSAPDKIWQSVEKLQLILETAVSESNLRKGDLFWPVRYSLSGELASASPAELLFGLGREESISRLERAIRVVDNLEAT